MENIHEGLRIVTPEIEKKRNATQGLPSRSPILVLLSPKHAKLRSSDGIWCFSAGMITSDILAPILPLIPVPSVLKPHGGPAPRPLANVLPPRLVPRDPVHFEY